MHQINNGERFVTDPLECLRTAFLVEETDVGLSLGSFHGAKEYTFQPDDVGRLVEVITEMSPGFISWGFGSIFADLRTKYPETKPYAKAE